MNSMLENTGKKEHFKKYCKIAFGKTIPWDDKQKTYSEEKVSTNNYCRIWINKLTHAKIICMYNNSGGVHRYD
jgi:hypothetical protein